MVATADEMRDTLRLWASGVSVVTTADGDRVAGMTVSAFNSLSIEPPLILVCLHKSATTAQLLQTTRHFAVSVLAAGQDDISDLFAGRVPLDRKEERFIGLPTHTALTGSPILSNSLAWLDCRVHEQHDGVTHWIVVGEVLATSANPARGPLLYYNRGYHTLG
ncbi:MAG TPA: flavin reductase family protein [Candidatus Limnocylindrales bacterium]|nr:flavin reductase family protein [Candidatus Limnocylindrales bacterium]